MVLELKKEPQTIDDNNKHKTNPIFSTKTSNNVIIKHADYTDLSAYKPNNIYKWYLMSILPASANIYICGIDCGGLRLLAHCISGSNTTVSNLYIVFLGIRIY